MYRAKLSALFGLVWMCSCSTDSRTPLIHNLDRPVDMAFACYGDLRLVGGEIIRTAQPVESCQMRKAGEIPPGQGELEDSDAGFSQAIASPEFRGFVLQSASGTIALMSYPAAVSGGASAIISDSDSLAPGKNAIPIGTLPVGLVNDRDGCHLVSANAGSCDLSIVDVNSALDSGVSTQVDHRLVVNAAGEPIESKPREIVAETRPGVIGAACPDEPTGMVYIAYPGCHLIAAVDSETGTVRAGVKFADDGSVSIVDGSVTCPSECGDGQTTPEDLASGSQALGGNPGEAARPVVLILSKDGRRLYAGSDNDSRLIIIDLAESADADMRLVFAGVRSVTLEGGVTVSALAESGTLPMGGQIGVFRSGSAGQFRFVYAVASDRTVRVVEVGDKMVECDTQVDPRLIRDVGDQDLLACMPVGSSRTPARRATARSPGIHFPGNVTPLAVALVDIDCARAAGPGEDPLECSALANDWAPYSMVGHFAFVTTSSGPVYIVNVDDDLYYDLEASFSDKVGPLTVTIPMAVAHQLRERGSARDARDDQGSISTGGEDGETAAAQTCGVPSPDRGTVWPHADRVSRDGSSYVHPSKRHMLPTPRRIQCDGVDDIGEPLSVSVSEFAFAAPDQDRENTFPDLPAVRSQRWFATWEGPLSFDLSSVAIDGPRVRRSRVVGGRDFSVLDATGSYCATGVRPFDIAVLHGCDPISGNADCGLGETCFVHPERNNAVVSGMCFPRGDEIGLTDKCRGILTSRREFTIMSTDADKLILAERRRILLTEPDGGCVDDDQCQEYAQIEVELGLGNHPSEPVDLEDTDSTPRSWSCGADPSRKPGTNHCMMTCDTDASCEDGWVCSSGFCVAGKAPPTECLASLQRYELRVGEAFSVIGSRTGFLHGRMRDEPTGACIDDPDAHPLLVGRLPLDAPACLGEGITDTVPNPCMTTRSQTEGYDDYTPVNGLCQADPFATIRTLDMLSAIRFMNPEFTMHMVGLSTRGDAVCSGDRLGERDPFHVVYPGYQLSWDVDDGAFPLTVDLQEPFGERIVTGPGGSLWIMNQAGGTNDRGSVVHIDPSATRTATSFLVVRYD